MNRYIDYTELADCKPCLRCVKLAYSGRIRTETVMPLPPGDTAPEAADGSGPCCWDCQSADNLQKLMSRGLAPHLGPRTRHVVHKTTQERIDDWSAFTFVMARVAVGNDRQEQLRMPGMPMGLAHPSVNLVRLSKTNALQDHHDWMDRNGLPAK